MEAVEKTDRVGFESDPSESLASWNRSAALEAVGGEEALLSEVIQVFLAESPKLMSKMEEALSLQDPRLLEFAAHSLRGALAYLGVPEASEAAEKVETAGRAGDIEGVAELFLHLHIRWAALCAALLRDPGTGVLRGGG